MKILTAKHKDKKGNIHSYRALVAMEKLYPTIKWGWHPENYQDIIRDIDKNGLDFPIVLLRSTVGEWLCMKNAQPNDLIGPSLNMCHNPSKAVLLIMCGNNRYNAAKELGFEYIDAVICDSKEEVNKLCKIQREDWRKKRSKLRMQPESQQE